MANKFRWREVKYYREEGRRIIQSTAVIIVLEDRVTKELYPHPLSHFLYIKYHRKSGSINSENAAASNIVPFLNFVINKVEENHRDFINLRGLADLRLEHANHYLGWCVKEKANSNTTLNTKEGYVSSLYKYLDDQGILKKHPKFIVTTARTPKGTITVHKLDFTYKKTDENDKEQGQKRKKIKRKDIVPQTHETNENRHLLRLTYIQEFLMIAKEETSDIAFGVALMIFGGLRKGELLNLVQSAIKPQNGCKYGELGLVVEVEDRQKTLFSRLTNTGPLQVKNPRDQACLVDKTLCYLYNHHLEYLKKLKNKQHPNALFYDTKGNPMSDKVFDERFLKLKNRYIGALLGTKGRFQEYLDFSQTTWRSHIGRGIFTNMCRDAGFSVEKTAILRGDSSTRSMEKYYDILSATYNIRKALGILEPNNYEMVKRLNMPFLESNWKDVEKFGYGIPSKK